MQSIVGKYKLYKNENTEDYFIAVVRETGVPYFGRRMIAMCSPVLEISVEGDLWTIRQVINVALLPNIESTFTLGQEYEEHMPNETIRSVTQLEGGELVTSSVLPRSGLRTTRRYTFTHDQCIVTMTHESLTTPAKRYFRRIQE